MKLLRLQAQGAIVRSIGENHRGVARADIGAIYTDDFYKLPPSIRFFSLVVIIVFVVMAMKKYLQKTVKVI